MIDLLIGVDIGGTRTKSGLVNAATGEVVNSLVQPTEKKDAQIFLQQIGFVIKRFQQLAAEAGNSIAGIGIGVPGFINEHGTVVTTYGFLEFMENYPLKGLIEKEFSLPCLIDNDARVVALGEALHGKGKGFKRVLTLTLGTGVGFGFIVNGRFTEPLPIAHMGGHLIITQQGNPCYCGKTGCLEALISSTGIVNAAIKSNCFGNEPSAEMIFAAALKGHQEALTIVKQVTDYLNTGIHNYINLFAPDMIVLGGGISNGLEPYLKKIRETTFLKPYPGYTFQLAISSLGETSGMLGSAALFQSLGNTQKSNA